MAEPTCDLCGYTLKATDLQYQVSLDIRPTTGLTDSNEDPGDRDHLLELHETLERLEDEGFYELPEQDEHQQFLLCVDCCRKLRANPLPRETVTPLDFSRN